MGASLVIIAAGCASFGLPGEAGVAMILAVDELMDMARTGVNLLGNCVATAIVARWEGLPLPAGLPLELAARPESPAPAEALTPN